MKIRTQKSIVLKQNFKNLMSILLPIVKKVIGNQINKIKSRVMRKMLPDKVQNTPKRVSNREIKSLENNFSISATKKIINTLQIAIEKPKIVSEAKVVTLSKITTKPKKVSKPKIIDKSEIVNQKNHQNSEEIKNRVIKQLKKYFKKLDAILKSRYLDDDDDEEYKGIRDLEHLLEENNEIDYYKSILVKSSHKEGYKEYESRGDKNKTLSIEQYLNKIIPYLKELINSHNAVKNGSKEWKIQLNGT